MRSTDCCRQYCTTRRSLSAHHTNKKISDSICPFLLPVSSPCFLLHSYLYAVSVFLQSLFDSRPCFLFIPFLSLCHPCLNCPYPIPFFFPPCFPPPFLSLCCPCLSHNPVLLPSLFHIIHFFMPSLSLSQPRLSPVYVFFIPFQSFMPSLSFSRPCFSPTQVSLLISSFRNPNFARDNGS